ncbi:MAG: hypothetical protein ABIF04_03715 [Chloroflexota bacterium]
MTFPAILFGVVLSTAYGTAFHFWKGGGLNKLLLFIVLAWLGFWIGHIIGGLIGWSFAAVGPLNVGLATIGSALFLFVGEWLSRVEVTHK